MAQERRRADVGGLLEKVFGGYPGSELGKPLKEGARIQGVVEGVAYNLCKRDGSLVIREGDIPNPDISVVLNREACEYIAGASDPEGFIERSRECITGRREGCLFEYRVHASVPRLLLKGYLDFARTFGIA